MSNLHVVGLRGGEKLDPGIGHRMSSRHDVFRVQPNVLDPRGAVLLQEGVDLIPSWNKCKHTVMQKVHRGP